MLADAIPRGAANGGSALTDGPSRASEPADPRYGPEEGEGIAPVRTPSRWFARSDLRDTRFWGLIALRGYLAFVFLQAAIGHLGVPFDALARTWTPTGAFAPLGASVGHDPALFVGAVVALELALALSMIVGVLTRLAGLGGLLLNAFFFAAFEWADRGQVYLSWDASLAALWLLVLLTAPGQYLGLGRFLVDRYPRLAPWVV